MVSTTSSGPGLTLPTVIKCYYHRRTCSFVRPLSWPRIRLEMTDNSSPDSIPLCIGPSMNSLLVIRRYLTLYQTSSGRAALLLHAVGSRPWRRHSEAAHLSSALNKTPSLNRRMSLLDASSATSLGLSSSKFSWRRISSGAASMRVWQANKSLEQATAKKTRFRYYNLGE